jgi:hypothetical protein
VAGSIGSPSASPATPASAIPASASPSGSGAASAIPPFAHVYLLMMENKEYGKVVGNPSAPFLSDLIARSALATNDHAITHPSQPNYVALVAGSTLGVRDDGKHDLDAPNLFDQIEAAGRSWAVFAQNVPLGCFRGSDATDGPDGPGKYVRKHNPAISFQSITGNPARCARITDFSHFDPAAADFEMIIPNMCNDMHDCPVSTGDAFLRSFVPRIMDSPAFADSVLFITWDEGTTNEGGGGQVALVATSPLARPGRTSSRAHDHYSLLHTIEEAWGLPCLSNACQANDLADLFR